MLAEERKADALDAFRVARRWFMAGRRIEMQELAAELGVNRATLFRWVGGRDDLAGEIVAAAGDPPPPAGTGDRGGHGGGSNPGKPRPLCPKPRPSRLPPGVS